MKRLIGLLLVIAVLMPLTVGCIPGWDEAFESPQGVGGDGWSFLPNTGGINGFLCGLLPANIAAAIPFNGCPS